MSQLQLNSVKMALKPKVAIIGCGPTGMFTIAAFIRAERMGEDIGEIVCFEKQDKMGGLWNYTWRTGTDFYGEPVHNSMYRYLWSNGPKEVIEMGDYTFDEHFGSLIPSYPTREVIYDYLMGNAKKYDIFKLVRVSTVVRYVKEHGKQFIVTSQNLKTQESTNETFDYVIVATGHFSVPFLPSYPGLENFNGQIIHSHNFRNASEYKGKTLLMVGNGGSGEDIALQSHKYGAKECIISYRSKPTGFKWPDGIREIPRLVKFENDRFHFVDGSILQVDAVIFCTGYLNHYPFMCDNIRLKTNNCLYPDHLYKGIIHKNNTRVLYLASQGQYYTFTLFDVQAYWARDYILGKIDIRSEDERIRNIKEWRERYLNLKDSREKFLFQSDYMIELMKDTDYPEHGHEKRVEILCQWKQVREDNIATYRDQAFPSTITGIMSPVLNIKWVDALDASLKTYLASIAA